MDIVGACRQAILGRNLRVVLPEATDERIIQAAAILVRDRIARPVLLGDIREIAARCDEAGISAASIDLHHPANDPAIDRLAALVLGSRPSLGVKAAQRLVSKPLYFAGAMVAAGDADAFVAGVANPTRRVIEAGLMTIGLSAGIEVPSSFFVMLVPAIGDRPQRALIFADCAVNADPSPRELAAIAIAAAENAHLLGEMPRVALLSFSTKGSAQHARVEKVREALGHAKNMRPDLAIDGEMQADTALSGIVAAKKMATGGDVAGQANVLIFPDLDSGNIAYKLVQELAGARAIGPFLQGFRRPISDLSRGATVDDIVATCIITLARSLNAAG